MKAKAHHSFSLRSQLLLASMGMVFVPMLLATMFSFHSQKEQIDTSLNRELDASISACKLFYDNIQERLEMVTGAIANDNTCKTTLRLGVLPQLQKQISALGTKYRLDFLIVTDTHGKVVAHYPQLDNDNVDFSNHPIISKTLQGKTTLSTTRKETHPLLIEAAIPQKQSAPEFFAMESATAIKIRETMVGTILSGITLSNNDSMMQQMRQASGADKTLLLSNKKIIAASYTPAKTHDNPLTTVVDKHADNNMLRGKLTTVLCPGDQRQVALKWHSLPTLPQEPGTVIMAILDYDRAATQIKNAIYRLIGVFAAGMGLAALIAFFVSRSIAAPIKALSSAVANIQDGVMEQDVPVRRLDEIGILTRGFNQMAAKLKNQFSELKSENRERKKAETQLEDEKERLAVTLRSIGDGVITTDVENRITFLNQMAERITGWNTSNALHQQCESVLQLQNTKTGKPVENIARTIVEDEQTSHASAYSTLTTKEGDTLTIANSGAPIRDREGRIIGAVIVFRDVTLEQQMENELLKVKKLESLGVLAGGIAHDFNNILAIILGKLELSLKRIEPLDKVAFRYLDDARLATVRASSLTKQLLTFSKGGEPVKETTLLPELIRESAEFVLHGSQVNCRYHFPDDLWLVDVDSGQISQVIQNIILNAEQAMAEGGSVDIRAININDPATESAINSKKGCFVKLMITDYGAGIPAETMVRIFDPYFSTKQAGSGLGLAICHSIIKKHDGHISVDSTPDEGTTFTIYLPALPAAAAPQVLQVGDDRRKNANSARILVLDDEQMLQDVIKSLLHALGHEAVVTADGAETITTFENMRKAGTPPDAIIIDLTIPGGMGGKETAEILLAIDPDVRLIVSSGYSNDPVMANYKDYGFCAALSKPFSLAEIKQITDQVLQ